MGIRIGIKQLRSISIDAVRAAVGSSVTLRSIRRALLKESTISKAVFVKKQIQPIFQALGKAQENEISWGKYKVL
jgi:hypothetical protein